MKKVLVLMTIFALSGCEPFPEETSSSSVDTPNKISIDNTTNSSLDASIDAPITSEITNSSNNIEPEQSTNQTISDTSPNVEDVSNPSVDEPQETPIDNKREKAKKQISSNAGKLEIVGTSTLVNGTIEYYYMKRIEQEDAICFMGSNSVTWNLALSCIPKPITTEK